MPSEIERKFLIKPTAWKPATRGIEYRQGYLSSVKARVVRVRIAGEKAFLAIKGATQKLSRLEFEYPIPMAHAATMLGQLCERPLIEKTRYQQIVGSHTWEIDVFHGDNHGLIVAEVEVSSETEAFERPSWVAEEVSGDPRYFNDNLIMNPFKAWGTTRAKKAKRIKPPRRVAKTAGAKKSSFKHASKRKSPRRRRERARRDRSSPSV